MFKPRRRAGDAIHACACQGQDAPPLADFRGDEPKRPGDYGIETVNGMAWLARAVEADETIKRRKGEEVIVYIQRLMPVDALRIRGRHNAATNALAALGLAVATRCSMGYAPRPAGLPRRAAPGGPVAVVEDVNISTTARA
jgi:UDP-N-acetylmuramoylalanine--D-glutamate ligase